MPGWWRWRATTTSSSPTNLRGLLLLRELTDFLAADRGSADAAPAADLAMLSPRELDVLILAARGLDNTEIAARLVLSVRTVERHL